MDRAFASGASASPPTAPASPSIGYATAGNPGGGTPPTKPGPWWFHMVTEELRYLVTQAGLTPDQSNLTQIKQALDALYGSQANAVKGMFANLQASATGASASISVSADEIIVENASNAYKTLRSVALTVAGTANGANGLDAGSLAINTWYSLWVIHNGTTTAGLLSLSATAPTMPSGYTHKARVGWIRTDGTGNKYPLGFKQFGRRVNYLVAAAGNVAALPSMASGSAGNVSTPTWAAVGVSNFVPPTAAEIVLGLYVNQVGVAAMVAPNNAYGAYTATTNPPPVMQAPSNVAGISIAICSMLLESSSIYWASSATTSNLFCDGWIDNL